jgi:oligopeptide transport system substrate-binding protein
MNYLRIAAFIAGFTLIFGLGSCSHKRQSTSIGTLSRGIGGEPSTLDPTVASDSFSFEVLRDLYEGLTTDGPNGEVLPGVAESWTVDSTGTEYTFQLRNNARWSDGTPIRAQDFVNAWRRVVDPSHASPVADDLRLIHGAASIISGNSAPTTLGVYASTDKVLTVKLEEPAPYLPQLLTQAAAYPMYSSNTRGGNSPKEWVSNGPYVLSGWSPGTTIDLAKNPNYWDNANVRINRVQYQIADENAQYARYRAGQLDVTDTVPANAIQALRESHPGELIIAPFLATAYYGLNLSAPPFGKNLYLRQAVAMAIDRKKLVKALAFGQVGAFGFVPPGTWNYSPQSWPWRDLGDDERIREAKRLYALAGYSSNQPLRLKVLFNSNPAIKNTAIIIAQMWKETLGIESVLTEEEYRVFLQSRHDKSRWDVARLGWTADYDDASNFLDIFRQHSSNNDSGYADQSFDTNLDEAAKTADPHNRRAILEAAERKMLAEYPVIPLYHYVSKRLVKPYIRGVHPNPLNRVDSKSISFSNR